MALTTLLLIRPQYSKKGNEVYIVDTEIFHEIVRDTTQISSCFSDFCVESQTNSCSISESLLHIISFLIVYTLAAVSHRLANIRIKIMPLQKGQGNNKVLCLGSREPGCPYTTSPTAFSKPTH